MGYIARQGSYSLAVSFLAAFIGVLNNLFIYPNYLEIHGKVQAILNGIAIALPFLILGLPNVILKYGHLFAKTKYSALFKYLTSQLLFQILYFAIFWIGVVLCLKYLVDLNNTFIDMIKVNSILILLIIIVVGIKSILGSIAVLNRNILAVHFLDKFIFNKIMIPAIVVLGYYFQIISLELYLILLASILISLIYFIVIQRNSALPLKWNDFQISKNIINEITTFKRFTFLNQTGLILAFSIDIVVVNIFLGDTSTGVYAIFLFLAKIVKLPMDSLGNLLSPTVSEAFSEKNINKIKDLYKRLSISIFIPMMIIISFTNMIFPGILKIAGLESQTNGILIFNLISFGILFNGMTMLNGTIIEQSEKYRYNTLFILILGILNLIMTILFVNPNFLNYGVIGAALSTSVSLVIFNLIKTIFVYFKFKMFPIQRKHFYIILLCMIYVLIGSLFRSIENPWLLIATNASLLLPLMYILFRFEFSTDLNNEVRRIFNKVNI